MPDSVVATDSQVAPTTPPQGTDAPVNDLAQAQDGGEGAKAAPVGFDEEWLKTLDPASRQTFEEKFIPKPVFTQKTQALAEERKRFEAEKTAVFELARKAIADRQVPAGPSADDVKRQKLQELVAQGDTEALQELVRMEAARQVDPIRTQVALQTAAQTARAANPAVVEHWNEIVQTMQNDPVIARMATMDNYAAADKVMIALGLEHQVRDLVPKYEAATKEIEGLKAKLQVYERERAAGLPSSTTRAGTTAGRPTAGEPTRVEEVDLRRIWKEAGGTDENFR